MLRENMTVSLLKDAFNKLNHLNLEILLNCNSATSNIHVQKGIGFFHQYIISVFQVQNSKKGSVTITLISHRL
jgi:hypothetical protein